MFDLNDCANIEQNTKQRRRKKERRIKKKNTQNY